MQIKLHILCKCTTKNRNHEIFKRKVSEHLFFRQKIAYFAPANKSGLVS